MTENKQKQFERHQNTAFLHLSDANTQILRMRQLAMDMPIKPGLKMRLRELHDACLQIQSDTTAILDLIRE